VTISEVYRSRFRHNNNWDRICGLAVKKKSSFPGIIQIPSNYSVHYNCIFIFFQINNYPFSMRGSTNMKVNGASS